MRRKPTSSRDDIAGQGANGAEIGLFGNIIWGIREFYGQPILTATIDGDLHYEAVGLCRLTEHSNPSMTLRDVAKTEHMITLDITAAQTTLNSLSVDRPAVTLGPNPRRIFVTREGANRIVLDSRSEKARGLKEWLADDVMTSVEDTGGYVAPGASLASIPDTSTPEGVLAIVDMLRDQVMARMNDAKTIATQAKKIKALEPAQALMKTYAGAKGLTTKRAFARDVQQWALDEGYDISQQQVFDFLHHIGLFIRSGTSEHDQAMSQAIKDRKAKNVTVKIEHADGSIEKKKYGKLTAKGEDYAWRRIHEALDEFGTLDLDVVKGTLVPVGR